MSLTLQDKKYIDTSINMAINTATTSLRKEIWSGFEVFRQEIRQDFQKEALKLSQKFQTDSNHYMSALIELVRDDIKKISEISSSKPDREEVREISQEEIRLHIYRPE